MTIAKYFPLLIITVSLIFTSCKKDPDEAPVPNIPTASTGSVNLHFENLVDTSALVLDTQLYINANGDTFNVTKFDYYISNVKLKKAGVVKYTESNSYHLLKANDLTTLDIALSGVPLDTYDGIEFMIGVDSARNVSGAQTGALDPANGMFWTWSSGYIMLKMEGTSPQSTAPANALEFHIGGFSGTNNVLKTVSPSFNSATANVTSSVTPEIHLRVNLLEVFTTPSTISFAVTNAVTMPGVNAKMISNNYADMFSVKNIHN